MYCDNDETAESIYCPEIHRRFPIRHHGPLLFLPVWRPTMEETLTCVYVDLTPDTDWDPYRSDLHLNAGIAKIGTKSLREQGIISDDLQHIGKVLMDQNLDTIFEKERLLYSVTTPGEPEFRSVSTLTAKKRNKLSPEELAKLWRIGLKVAKHTLGATTHMCIRTVGNLTHRFKTDKAHLRYKRLATQEGSFYVDTLFSKVKLVQGLTCGNLYTKTLGFKKNSSLWSLKLARNAVIPCSH